MKPAHAAATNATGAILARLTAFGAMALISIVAATELSNAEGWTAISVLLLLQAAMLLMETKAAVLQQIFLRRWRDAAWYDAYVLAAVPSIAATWACAWALSEVAH